jgi:alpha-glycerophosphate oxidase/glycerol-3-phosphate dehydrogenase
MNPLRSNHIDRAQSEIQDCLVVGAGINGAVAAAALSGHGVKTTIIDQSDFASFTSQESSNLAWGGIKYLESYEFGLVWGLCKSRNRLMKAYPSQVKEIRFFTSIAKGFRKPRLLVYLGALLYWVMGRFKTRPPRLLSRSAIQRKAPMINTRLLVGGMEYSDCFFMDNDTRFCFGFIRKAIDQECNAINYMKLIAADRHDDLWRCTLEDQLSGETLEIEARSLVNAGGPFTDKVEHLLNIDSTFKHIFSKGVHIIVPPVTKVRHVLTFFASDGRLFFMIPMGPCTCIGTTDTRVDSEVVQPTSDDIAFLIANANALLNLEKPLSENDVISNRCGVRPLVVKQNATVDNADWTELSRKHEIDIHPDKKMLSIYGGKLTDCLNVGDEVAAIIESFGIKLTSPAAPWFGEPAEDIRADFIVQCRSMNLDAMTATNAYEPLSSRLWRRYGKDAFDILEEIRTDASMAEILIQGASYIRAELHHTARKEMVLHLDDFMRRRSKMALVVDHETIRTAPGLKEAAQILFGNDADTEIERYFNPPTMASAIPT